MCQQLAQFAAVAETGSVDRLADGDAPAGDRCQVSLRVLPFTSGAHAAAGQGTVTLLCFAETPDIGIMHLAALSGGVSLEGRDMMTRYLRAFAQLRAASLDSKRTVHAQIQAGLLVGRPSVLARGAAT
jgi:hypothetical protein